MKFVFFILSILILTGCAGGSGTSVRSSQINNPSAEATSTGHKMIAPIIQ